MMDRISVVVPVYNEVDVLPVFFARVRDVLNGMSVDWELVFVDDGSRDGSWTRLEAIRSTEGRVSLIRLSRNFGHQLAITAGMDHAVGDAVVVLDADLQDPPEVIPSLVERWRAGFDVVYAVRERRPTDGWFKRTSARLWYRVIRGLSPVDLPVDVGDFRLLSRRAVDGLGLMPERARYVRGMVAWLGYPTVSVPYVRASRAAGITKFPLHRMLAFATDGLVGFSTVPLRAATTLGFVMALGALLYFGHALGMKLWFDRALHGWTSLVAVIVLIGSAQLICLGIIGEYVGRIYEQVKGRPLYVVGETRLARSLDERPSNSNREGADILL